MSEAESAGVVSSEALVNLRPFVHGVGRDEDPFEVIPGLGSFYTMAGSAWCGCLARKIGSDVTVSVLLLLLVVVVVVVVVV